MTSRLLWVMAASLGCGGVATGEGTAALGEGEAEERAPTPPPPGVSEHPAGPGPRGSAATGRVTLRGGIVVGQGALDVTMDPASGRIVDPAPGDDVIDVGGRWLTPAFIDSHVHLTYHPIGEALKAAGIAAAVDLASPERSLGTAASADGLRVLASGPMVTPPAGYPTQSWGADGYGVECLGATACRATVTRLLDRGAHLIKLPGGQGPDHDPATLAAIVEAAHARGALVAAHALQDDATKRAAAAGVDVLAHTPVEALTADTLAAWTRGGGRAVISTLAAFGGAPTTVDNLRRLRGAGATVLYGTDLGNTRVAGISAEEIALLAAAGLDGEAILASGTRDPAKLWGLDDLGRIGRGMAASLLVLDGDPLANPSVLATPAQVWINGVRQR